MLSLVPAKTLMRARELCELLGDREEALNPFGKVDHPLIVVPNAIHSSQMD